MSPDSHGRASPPIEVSAHDSSQVEIKAIHHVPDGLPLGDTLAYVQQVYFFLPKSLGLMSESYSKDLFYRSLTNHIRVKTPRILREEELRHSRIDRIMPRLCACAAAGTHPSGLIGSVNEVRLFGAYINDQLKILTRADDPFLATVWIENVTTMIASFRSVMDKVAPSLKEGRWSQLGDAFRYVDEFLSNRLEECLVVFKGRGVDLTGAMHTEFARRGAMGYLQVLTGPLGEEAPEADRERFVFRMGRFKKYISELLYLEVKRTRHDRLFTNLAAMFGAATAAFINALADPNQRTSVSGHFFVNVRDSLPLMVGVVALVYVFKDRVKEVFRERLLSWLKPWLPDYSFIIRSKDGRRIARCREEVRFVRSTEVPADVGRLREDNREIILPSDSFEDVIAYSRSLKMNRQALESTFQNTNSLKDMLRFDFNPFLAKLSNAWHRDTFLGPGGDLHEVSLPKVYHVNVIVKHQVVTAGSGALACNYCRVRLVLDRDGIKRVEQMQMKTGDEDLSSPPVQKTDSAA